MIDQVSSINLYLPYTITIHKNTSNLLTNINNTSKSESNKVYIKLPNQLNTQNTNIPSKLVTNINNTSKSESNKVYIKLPNQLNTQNTNIPIYQNTAIWREKAGRPERRENGLPLNKS